MSQNRGRSAFFGWTSILQALSSEGECGKDNACAYVASPVAEPEDAFSTARIDPIRHLFSFVVAALFFRILVDLRRQSIV
jgi:hypothetical protein